MVLAAAIAVIASRSTRLTSILPERLTSGAFALLGRGELDGAAGELAASVFDGLDDGVALAGLVAVEQPVQRGRDAHEHGDAGEQPTTAAFRQHRDRRGLGSVDQLATDVVEIDGRVCRITHVAFLAPARSIVGRRDEARRHGLPDLQLDDLRQWTMPASSRKRVKKPLTRHCVRVNGVELATGRGRPPAQTCPARLTVVRTGV